MSLIKFESNGTKAIVGVPLWDLNKRIQFTENPAISVVSYSKDAGLILTTCDSNEDFGNQTNGTASCRELNTTLMIGDYAKVTYNVTATNLTGNTLNWASILNVRINGDEEADDGADARTTITTIITQLQMQKENSSDEWINIGATNTLFINASLSSDNNSIIVPLMGSVNLGNSSSAVMSGIVSSDIFRLVITISEIPYNHDSEISSTGIYPISSLFVGKTLPTSWIIHDSPLVPDTRITQSATICYTQLVPVNNSNSEGIVDESAVSLYDESVESLVKGAADSATRATFICATPTVEITAVVDQENENKWAVAKEAAIIPSTVPTRNAQYWINNGPLSANGLRCACEELVVFNVSDQSKAPSNPYADCNWPAKIIDEGLFLGNKNILKDRKDICTLLNRPDACGCSMVVPLLLNRLTQQLTTALFNQANGVYVPPFVQDTIYKCQILLDNYNVLDCVELKPKDHSSAITYTTVLEKFNTGLLTDSGPHNDNVNYDPSVFEDHDPTMIRYNVKLNKEVSLKKTPQVSFAVKLNDDLAENDDNAGHKLPYEKLFNWELEINGEALSPPVRGKVAVPANTSTSGTIIIGDLTNDDIKVGDKISIKLSWLPQVYDIKNGIIEDEHAEESPEAPNELNTDKYYTASFDSTVVDGDIVNTESTLTEQLSVVPLAGESLSDYDEIVRLGYKTLHIAPTHQDTKKPEFTPLNSFVKVDGKLVAENDLSSPIFEQLVNEKRPLTIPLESRFNIPNGDEIVLSYLVVPHDVVSKVTSVTTIVNVTGSNEVNSTATTSTTVKHLRSTKPSGASLSALSGSVVMGYSLSGSVVGTGYTGTGTSVPGSSGSGVSGTTTPTVPSPPTLQSPVPSIQKQKTDVTPKPSNSIASNVPTLSAPTLTTVHNKNQVSSVKMSSKNLSTPVASTSAPALTRKPLAAKVVQRPAEEDEEDIEEVHTHDIETKSKATLGTVNSESNTSNPNATCAPCMAAAKRAKEVAEERERATAEIAAREAEGKHKTTSMLGNRKITKIINKRK